jgi:DNA-binding transcriptional ArsR family regulator
MTAVNPSAAGLRALSHPTRLKMLMLLRLEGPATATTLADQLSLNTGATSYHLRQLAEHGFIEEDAGRGDGRDRWWRAAHESTHAGLAGRDLAEADDVNAYLQTVALMYTEQLMQAVAERTQLPEAWQRASTTSDWHFRVSPARAEELVARLAGILQDFEEDEGDEAGSFVVNLNAFPRPGTVARRAGR